MARGFFLLLTLFALADTRALAEIQVAVAANFAEPARAIATEFTRESATRVLLSSGSSGKIFAQIKSGAPFDVFLSADQEHALRLGSEGLADDRTRFTYAIGKLVLWSSRPGFVDPEGKVLRQSGIRHLAIANPETAPYGKAAKEILDRLGLWSRLQPRLVIGQSVAQAFQFVESGNAELGFVAWAQAKDRGGSYWLPPVNFYGSLKQDAVLLKKGKANREAQAFLAFLKGPKGRALVQKFGYGLEGHD